ncbi:MAG: DNA repair protein RecO, partial [Anaerotignaceae bacterium]
MDNDKIRGIVLKEYPMGESSKRIVVLTKDRGKITLSVRGGKNALSKFLTSTQLFCYSDFVVCKSKGFLFVNQSEVIESFYALREDIERLACSAFILEVVEKTVFEQMESKDILRLLLRTMKAMAKEK